MGITTMDWPSRVPNSSTPVRLEPLVMVTQRSWASVAGAKTVSTSACQTFPGGSDAMPSCSTWAPVAL